METFPSSGRPASNVETLFLSSLLRSSDPAHPIAGAIYTRDHPSYSSVLNAYIHNLRFSQPSTPKPFLILTALHESHVQAAVIAAAKTGIQMKIRSGGHDYEGRSYTSSASSSATAPFFILDMCNLRGIRLDIESETAWVECGATLGELYYRIAEQSRVHAFPAGACSTVGVGGHLVGGGYGTITRKFGLAADNIVDARVVNASGEILDGRESMGEDLFWAIRGGGSSFAIVLAYKVKLVRVPEVVTVLRVERTLEENATDLVYTWQNVGPTADADLFLKFVVEVVGKERSNSGEKTIRASFKGLYLGRAEKLMSIMGKTFPELGLKETDCKEMSWIETVPYWMYVPEGTTLKDALLSRRRRPDEKLVYLKLKSDYVEDPISKECLEKIWTKMMELEVVKMGFNPYGGRMGEISPEAIPFPHRAGNLCKIQYQTSWTEEGPEAERRHLDSLREMYDYMTPYVSSSPRSAFVNYIDLDFGINGHRESRYEEARRYGLRYFKGNFERLVKIKSRVDPGNVFRSEQSVPTLDQSKL
ncbi:Berberine bridge enzyme-like 8 [Linum grandiflorum]